MMSENSGKNNNTEWSMPTDDIRITRILYVLPPLFILTFHVVEWSGYPCEQRR